LTTNHIERDRDGFIHVPDAPGLGMAVNVARLKDYLVDAEIRFRGQVIYRTPELD
jgi:L-alanine-DL-glutamate epimerase-like enolase superfamily enzyme